MAQKKRPGFRLKSPADVRRLIARTANRFDQGEISEVHARTLGYLANIAIRTMEVAELADQLTRIEEKVGKP